MKKALVLFGNEENTENLIKSCVYLKEKFGYDLTGLLVRDIRTETITIGQGGGIYDAPTSLFVGEMIKFEKEQFDLLTKKMREKDLNIDLKYEVGIVKDTIKEYMKEFDLLVIGKGIVASDVLMELLRENYKSLLIVGEQELNFSNIYIANDDGVKVNRSCYNFINMFPTIKNMVSVEVNGKDKNQLISYLKSKKIEIKEEKKPNQDDIVNYFKAVSTNGVLIMGNLSKSYFMEKISGKTGIKLIEEAKLSIYIG